MMTGNELRTIRKKKWKLTQQELADQLQVTRQTVVRLENEDVLDRRTELAVIGLWTVRKRLDKLGYSG